MQTLIMLYNLQEGVSLEDYIDFSKKVDQPIVNSFDCIKDFAVHYVLGPDKNCQIFEVIKIISWEEWEKFTQTDTIKKHEKEWLKYVNPDSVKISYGNRIE